MKLPALITTTSTMRTMAFVLLFVMVASTMEERIFEDPENTVEKRDAANKDILSTFSCRYLKNHGFLSANTKLIPLCLVTYSCSDIFSNISCHTALARKECDKDSKLSLKYCPYTCNKCGHQCKGVALGMQSKTIPNSKITASSFYSSAYAPSNARLHMNGLGWGASSARAGEWLQVDLSSVTTVTAIATQGAKTAGYWVKSYSLQYSLDGSTFKNFQQNKVFTGNTDQNTVVKHVLNPPIIARYIRVVEKTFNGWPDIRMELYGCK